MGRVLAALGILVFTMPAVAGQPPSAAELARALQARYEQIRDFSADFIHTYEGGVLKKKMTERGKLVVKKPGKMRWTYTAPEEKLFVSDGRKMYAYVPADKQVIISDVPAADRATTPVLFLVGKGNLARDFAAAFTELPGGPANTLTLKLTPRQRQPEYDWLALVVDRASLQLRMLAAADAQGGRSTFTFLNLKENVGLADKIFTFSIPRGVDVVTAGTPSGVSQ